MSDNLTLGHCPFCGSPGGYQYSIEFGWHVECLGCGAQGPVGNGPVDARAKWNHRGEAGSVQAVPEGKGE